ncbi:hypothetical protein Pcinc_042484 [Petrolisthes cinctipes]|uniref:Uncharacterized protein n=1 Tax=Petrolisthes cinctipes TaxID=88211 RepID=A0AAE1BHF0_PETCI|nr:hypothetical protein Pcinc_042484 [Petrolisthes cinctipes]
MDNCREETCFTSPVHSPGYPESLDLPSPVVPSQSTTPTSPIPFHPSISRCSTTIIPSSSSSASSPSSRPLLHHSSSSSAPKQGSSDPVRHTATPRPHKPILSPVTSPGPKVHQPSPAKSPSYSETRPLQGEPSLPSSSFPPTIMEEEECDSVLQAPVLPQTPSHQQETDNRSRASRKSYRSRRSSWISNFSGISKYLTFFF